MASIREYSPITRDEYFRVTQFDKSKSQPVPYHDLVSLEHDGEKLHILRVEITRSLAEKILRFIRDRGLSTRGAVPDLADNNAGDYSRTVFTVRFSLHLVVGKRGGWYVLATGGREPRVKDEFIEYGPKRKSGGRKGRYRRKLSYSEQNQVEFLENTTPSLEKIYQWIMEKYPGDVRNIDFRYYKPLELRGESEGD